MNKDITHIAVVLDKSGSMATTVDETIAGFNKFLAEQKEQPGKAYLTLALFDSEYALLHDGAALRDVPSLSRETYVPNGGTALFDAVGKTMSSVRAKIAALPPEKVPGKVIFLVITDGAENASQEIRSRAALAQLIDSAKTTDAWQFVFIGANIDAMAESESLGVAAGNTLQYDQRKGGTEAMYGAVTRGMSSYRSQDEVAVNSFFDPNAGPIVKP